MTILYKVDKSGRLRFWEVEVFGDELIRRHGMVGGEIQERSDFIRENTLRDSDEQALSRADSEIRKRLERGYRYTVDEAYKVDSSLNNIGMAKPMLAGVYSPKKHIINFETCIIQRKYNGHRCLITNIDGEMVAYSRGAKLIDSIPEILSGIKIPEGTTLDGELYSHGQPLQTISSWVRRRQENSKKLTFMAYDLVSDNYYQERLEELRSYDLGLRGEVAPTIHYEGDLDTHLYEAMADGYEGLILRPDNFGYEHKRSKGLLKVKKRLDGEFLVSKITTSADGWAVLHCVGDNGKIFRASAPGNFYSKKYVIDHKEKFVGQYVQIAYPELTESGIPAQPVALGWRNKEIE